MENIGRFCVSAGEMTNLWHHQREGGKMHEGGWSLQDKWRGISRRAGDAGENERVSKSPGKNGVKRNVEQDP